MKNIKSLPKASGIYMVKNIINEKIYIGQSKNIYSRFNNHHIFDYKNEQHNCFNTKFYQALRKYGLNNFIVSIVELCPENQLNEKEIFYIQQFNSFRNGYNSTEGGQNWSENIHSLEAEEKRKKTREKNDSLKSENHPRAKLTNEEVVKIRQRYINGESIPRIYDDYNQLYHSIAVFRRIVLGKTYISAGNIPNKEQIRYTNAKLTDIQVREIRTKYQVGKTSYAKLGKEYGVTAGAIAGIIQGKSYKHVN